MGDPVKLQPPSAEPPAGGVGAALLKAAAVLVFLYIFLTGIKGLGDGFKSLGSEVLDVFFTSTSNPLIGLMVGILATTLMQSSSVTTSLIVGLVAAPDNPLPIANAVPMIMGANIGTTVTNTIVSLAHMGRRDEFVRAFSIATCHDFFNFMTVAVLLPLELATGFLTKTATYLATSLGGVGGIEYESPLKNSLEFALKPVKGLIHLLTQSERAQAVLLILVSGVLIVTALLLVVRVLRSLVQTKVEVYITKALGSGVALGVVIGMIATVAVQSSSITTSLLVPLGGAGVITLRQAFPITVGANIGTTVTALLATMAVSGENANAGLIIALVHLLFNLIGTLAILPFPRIREIPLILARRLALVAVESRKWAVLYVMLLFYGVPALLAFLNRVL